MLRVFQPSQRECVSACVRACVCVCVRPPARARREADVTRWRAGAATREGRRRRPPPPPPPPPPPSNPLSNWRMRCDGLPRKVTAGALGCRCFHHQRKNADQNAAAPRKQSTTRSSFVKRRTAAGRGGRKVTGRRGHEGVVVVSIPAAALPVAMDGGQLFSFAGGKPYAGNLWVPKDQQ